MSNRNSHIWSEHQKGRHRSTDDIMAGVGLGVDSLDTVVKSPTSQGVVCKFDCGRCGRQTAILTPWPEMACYFRGVKVKGASPTAQGLLVRIRCSSCRRVNRVLWSWPEVHQHVTEAVRLRRLPPAVLGRGG